MSLWNNLHGSKNSEDPIQKMKALLLWIGLELDKKNPRQLILASGG